MLSRILAPVMILMVASGCAKKKDYEKLHIDNPEAHIQKSVIESMCSDVNDPCLYVPSVENTPYNVTASRPYWQGEEKLVIAQIGESEVKFLQVEADARFADNANNFSPVLSLPVSHKHYKCKEDDYGDCTNTEELDTERHWSKRKYLHFDLNKIDVKEANTLPIQMSELFNAGCFSAIEQEVKKFKVEKDTINIVVRKTYKASAKCVALNELDDLRYLIFSVDYGYSIAKLSSVSDPAYQQVDYPVRDEAHFGFFKTEHKHRSVDNRDDVLGVRKNLLNRWSPNKKQIVYYLNGEFYRPENKIVLDSTYEAIESVNNSLRKAKAGFEIVLKNGEDKSISDIRNNFIVFVKDPQASGVIGYGPSVVNPITGEIVNARTVMYYGTIVKMLSRTYDELVEEHNEKVDTLNRGKVDAKEVLKTVAQSGHNHLHAAHVDRRAVGLDRHSLSHVHEYARSEQDYFSTVLDDLLSRPVDLAQLQKQSSEFEKKINAMAMETFYHESQFNFYNAVEDALQERVARKEKLKLWIDLSEQERAEQIKLLLPYVWIPTLVHEFGHNLGLRHNFAGSTDKHNYYTSQERSAMGMKREVTYSSIMDYAYRQTNELPIMGKYDVAALRFAYAREVETKDGSFVKVPSTIVEMMKEQNSNLALKKYEYCSDEHVGTNPTCNRFDEGSSYEAVAKHYAESFMQNYHLRNFRGRRYSFEGRTGDLNYLQSVFSSFVSLRSFFDIFDQRFAQGAYDEEKAKEDPELIDIKKASDVAFNFFMDVLETPAYHCAVMDKEKGQLVAVLPFVELAKNSGISFDLKDGCDLFNQGANGKYDFYSFGKYLNNTIDIKVDRTLVRDGETSEMDVRGMWMDKAVATMLLSMRMKQPTTLGTSSSGNFLDYPDYRQRFMSYADGLLKNRFVGEVELSIRGQVVGKAKLPYSFDSSDYVNASYNRLVNALFGLNSNKTNFKDIFMSQLKSNLVEVAVEGNLEQEDTLHAYFDVDKVSTRANLSDFNYDYIVEFKRKNNEVAYRFGMYDYNEKAVQLRLMKVQLDLVTPYPQEVVQFLAAALDKELSELPENVPAEVKQVLTDLLNKTTQAMVGPKVKVEFNDLAVDDQKVVKEVVKDTLGRILAGSLDQNVLLHSFLALSK